MGYFLPNDERIAKCDTTQYLVPGTEFTSRAIFELFGEERDSECIAVGITAVRIDDAVEIDLPFLKFDNSGCLRNSDAVEEDRVGPQIAHGTKVYAIFCYWPGSMGQTSVDVDLCGVYTKRDDAIQRGLELARFDDEDMKAGQVGNAPNVTNGRLFFDSADTCFTVAIETVVLNEDHGGELDIGTVGDYCWDSSIDIVEFF